MKKYFVFLLGMFLSVSLAAQVKIQDMPTLNSKPASAWVPIVSGGINKKVRADSIASLAKTDTNLIKKIAHDSTVGKVKYGDTAAIVAGYKNAIISNKTNLDSSKANIRNEVSALALPYKEYAIILSQVGAAAPTVATLLRNELSGPIVWTRTGIGSYVGTLTGAFTVGKTIVTPMSFYSKLSGKGFYAYAVDANTINILVRDDSGAFADLNISQATDLTIRVYN